MRHPFQAVPFGRRAEVFLPLLILTLLTGTIVSRSSNLLKGPASTCGIVSFELAGDPAAAKQIVRAWGPDGSKEAAFNLGLDYLFLVLYSTTLAFACVWAAGQIPFHWASALGPGLAWLQWVAGTSDAAENTSLLHILFAEARTPFPQLARTFALLKFTLVALGLLYAALGGLWYLANRIGLRAATPPQESR